ncbi:MAG: CrcB family protein [Mycobacteriales bacterium]|nr:CrcB family protein [Mycobacteriales bacterium]
MGIVALVVLGGALGSLARYAVLESAPTARPATLLVNLSGCLLIGLLVARRPTDRARAFLGTGVLGGFTTMSAVAVDVASSEEPANIVYLAISVVGGVALCRLGLALGARR